MKIVVTHSNLKSITDNDQIPVSIQDLGSVENSSCISVHLADCMDYIPGKERAKLMAMVLQKLRYGGEVTISGTDVLSVSSQLLNGQITVGQANTALFSGRLSCSTVNNMVDFLQQAGLQILNAKLDGLFYSIKARRPNV